MKDQLIRITRQLTRADEVKRLYEKYLVIGETIAREFDSTIDAVLYASRWVIQIPLCWEVEASRYFARLHIELVGESHGKYPWYSDDAALLALKEKLGGETVLRTFKQECGCTREYPVLLLEETDVGYVIAHTGDYEDYPCSRHKD